MSTTTHAVADIPLPAPPTNHQAYAVKEALPLMSTAVRAVSDISVPGASHTLYRYERATRDNAPGSRMAYSRLIGALFLVGFLFYGVGAALVTSVTGTTDFLSTISAHQTTLVIGAFLMLLNTAVDVGKGVLFFPILENHGKRSALAYLAFIVVQVVMLDVGVLALLLIVPLGQQTLDAGQASAAWAQGLGSLLIQWNNMAYSIGEATLGVGGLFLCSLLFRTRLIPRFLAVGGLVGYVSLMVGMIAELFGLHIGLMLSIPGIFFEVGLPVWLVIKGFQPEAYSGRVAEVMTPSVLLAPATP
jgi:hypothetical protein